jgi:LEA14-like dessication related protein
MKVITIAIVILITSVLGYKIYTYFNSVEALNFDIVDVDFSKFTFTIRFKNTGSSPIKVSAVDNSILINGKNIGNASNLSGFTINSRSEKNVKFTITTGVFGGANLLTELIRSDKKSVITVDTVINVKGIIIKKTTNI